VSSSKNPETNQKKLTARQERIAAAMAAGRIDADICREFKVAVSTLWLWKKQPAFRQRIEELRHQLIDRSIGRLSELMAGKALDVLNKRLDKKDPDTGETSATLDDVKAAFELFVGIKNAADLQSRLEELERRAKGS
jgi:hypothetical protein